MGLLGDAHGWGAKWSSFLKTCHTYPTMIKIGTVMTYPKKIQKIYELRDTPLLLTSAFFHRISANFAISKNTDIDCILINNFYLFELLLSVYRLL